MWTLVNNCYSRSVIDTHVQTENWNVNWNSADRNYKMEDFIKKKSINSSDNIIIINQTLESLRLFLDFGRKENYLIKVKKRTNKEQMKNLHQILMKIKYFPKILPQLDDLSAEGNHVGEKNIKSQIMSQNT